MMKREPSSSSLVLFLYICIGMAKKKLKAGGPVDPGYLRKQKEALVRKNRQVLYFNDAEMGAVKAYCEKFKIRSKSALMREIIVEKVISELEENHPTLF